MADVRYDLLHDPLDQVRKVPNPWWNPFVYHEQLVTPEQRQRERAPLGLRIQPGDINLPVREQLKAKVAKHG